MTDTPKSKYVKVKCPDCGNEQPLFARAATPVTCLVCGATLAKPTGGLASLRGEVVGALE